MSDEEINVDGRTREARALKAAAPATTKETREQSLARAEARARAIRGNPDLQGMERDKYYAPPPPEGFDYQWKLKSVLNQDDLDRIRQVEAAGWEPVPRTRHPELMPRNYTGDTIEVGGLVLMERPMMFTMEARAEERRAAREAVLTKERLMKEGRGGDLGPRQVNRFSKSHESIDVPNE
jgi:hypothetical protein